MDIFVPNLLVMHIQTTRHSVIIWGLDDSPQKNKAPTNFFFSLLSEFTHFQRVNEFYL